MSRCVGVDGKRVSHDMDIPQFVISNINIIDDLVRQVDNIILLLKALISTFFCPQKPFGV